MQPNQVFRGGYAQPGPSRPGQHAPPRRGGIGPIMSSSRPHASVPLTQAQLHQHQQAVAHASEQAKRRSRKPTDKEIPDDVEDLIIGDGVKDYNALRAVERRIDAIITRKRTEILESVDSIPQIPVRMRVAIINTVEDQPWQETRTKTDAMEFSGSNSPSYRVRMLGTLVNCDDLFSNDDVSIQKSKSDGDQMLPETASGAKPSASTATASTQPYKFSHFFKNITVDFPPEHAVPPVEWKRPDRHMNQASWSSEADDFEQFIFKRPGDTSHNITINLDPYQNPEKYAVSPELQEIVCLESGTLHEVTQNMWLYINSKNLLEDAEHRNFRCDDQLRAIVGQETGYLPLLTEYVSRHLRSLPPIRLPYTVRMDKEFHSNPQPTLYEVTVTVDNPLALKYQRFLRSPTYGNILKECQVLNDQIAVTIQAITASKAKHDFLAALKNDPVNAIKNFLSSTKRDLEVIQGEAIRGGGESASGDEYRRSGPDSIWATPNARQSVQAMLTRAGPR